MSDTEKELLAEGCKFTPVPSQNLTGLQNDAISFCRRLRLIDFFKDKDQTEECSTGTPESIKIKGESNFEPPKGLNPSLDSNIDLILNETEKFEYSNRRKYNLSKEQRLALHRLKNRDDLHITKSDKGGAFVVMNYVDYRHCIYNEHLQDTNTYRPIFKYEVKSTLNLINRFCKRFSNCLTTKEAKYLSKFSADIPFIYGLPKIHKIENINFNIMDEYGYMKTIIPDSLKLRPIISSEKGPTNRLSYFLDELIKPLTSKLPSFCRDTAHFISKLPKEAKNSMFVSFDVTSLYTNIDNDLGLTAMEFWIEKYRDLIDERYTTAFILNGISIVLKNNFFSFEDNFYLQISGTAMGTRLAPTYATLSMGYLEQKMYVYMRDVLSTTEFNEFHDNWLRYLDDCFVIWKDSFGDITNFHQFLNNMNDKIKFTLECNKNKLNFLDVCVYKEDEKIETDVFYKPTDSHNYVSFNSNHPKHIIKNIPYTLARRINNIVSKSERKMMRYDELRNQLLTLGYPQPLISDAISRAENKITSNKNEQHSHLLVPFVTTFNPNNPAIFQNIVNPIFNSLKVTSTSQNYRIKRSYR